ncbi:RluA family pseudouridine synthase [Latilactobacillus graminis]|uniref:Pseudouridine synthase n=2 Tax=Latilactobacillus graminis TaxID=60519 RepID=A0AA89HZX8_9LACO|nr:RluA family pseudouridine synthase [Latilactobacillus graminis]KRM21188.1 pseudouridine synthase, RluA family protein [Latilactobacillus graminis DSM 20719]QFP79315.1 RluA family pseudouridine synthase [Latilactobacillus graminis]
MEIKWHVQHTQSVKQFLLASGISQRLYTKIKATGQRILINEQKSKPSDQVHIGDVVSVHLPAEPADQRVIVSHEPIVVCYEDDYWLAVNKPAGLATIPGPTNQTDTLLNRIKGYWQSQGLTDLVPHIITRLDFDTSGLVLIAKHQVAQSLLQPQIEHHQLRKFYLAVVAGGDLPQFGEIRAPIGKIDHQPRRAVIADGQAAWTSYWRLGGTAQLVAVKVQIHTGRTHQIRVHFSAMGHPLIGDQLYGGPLDQGITRQALHAYQLQFKDPFSQQLCTINAPIATDIQAILPKSLPIID